MKTVAKINPEQEYENAKSVIAMYIIRTLRLEYI